MSSLQPPSPSFPPLNRSPTTKSTRSIIHSTPPSATSIIHTSTPMIPPPGPASNALPLLPLLHQISAQSKSASDPPPFTLPDGSNVLSDDQPAFPLLSTSKAILLALTITSTSIISAMAGMAVLLVLPDLGRDLGIRQGDLVWVLNAFNIAFGCALLPSGRLADIFGRKYTYIVGLLIFSVFTLSCGLVHTPVALFVLRGLAGLGSSLANPAAVGIIAENFPEGRSRSLMYSAFGAGNPLGAALGVVISGLMAQYVEQGWRKIFYILFGTSIILPLVALFLVPNRRPDPSADKRIDFLGAGLITGGMIMFLYVLTAAPGSKEGWRTPYILALLVLSIFLVAAFIGWQYFVEHKLGRPPLMRLALFTRGNGRLAVVYTYIFFVFASFIGYFFLTDLYYQQYLELSPVHTMLRYLPTSVSGILCNVLVGLLVPYISGQILLCAGAVMTALAPLLFAINKDSANYFTNQFFGMILCVAGADFGMATGFIFVARLCLPSEQSVGGGLFQTFNQIGAALGTTVASLVTNTIAAQRRNSVAHPDDIAAESGFPREALKLGLNAAFWTCAAFAFGALALGIVFLRGMGTVEDKKKSVDSASETSMDDRQGEVDKRDEAMIGMAGSGDRKL